MDAEMKTLNGRAVRQVTEGLSFDPMPLKLAFAGWGRGYAALGKLIGVSGMTCRNLIVGKFPTSKNLPRLAGVLGVNLRDCWKIDDQEAKAG